jgi:hypothetical protein
LPLIVIAPCATMISGRVPVMVSGAVTPSALTNSTAYGACWTKNVLVAPLTRRFVVSIVLAVDNVRLGAPATTLVTWSGRVVRGAAIERSTLLTGGSALSSVSGSDTQATRTQHRRGMRCMASTLAMPGVRRNYRWLHRSM